MSWTEVLGTLFGVICVWLTVIQHIGCWPAGILNNVFFLMLFAKDRLYADALLQGVYIAVGIYGWHHWLHGGRERTPLPVSATPARAWPLLGLAFATGTAGLAALLVRGAGVIGVPPPDRLWWDCSTTVLCLVAQYMLTRKWLENWVVWIATNLSYIGLYAVKGRYLVCALQVVFIALSVQGWRAWRRDLAGRECEGEAGTDDTAFEVVPLVAADGPAR